MRNQRVVGVSLLVIIIMAVLTACSGYTGHRDLNQAIVDTEQLLVKEDWDGIKKELDNLMSAYKKNSWKLQMIGDEGEYERMHESIYRLIAAVEAQAVAEAKLELATVKAIVEDIYSL